MKILAVSHEYPPLGGGGANAARYLLGGLADRGYEVSLVTTHCCNRTNSQGKIILYGVNSKRKREDSCSFTEMLDYLIKACKVAEKIIKKAKKDGKPYDICLVFFGIPSGPIGYYLKKKYGLPYVIRFGGGDIPGFQKRFNIVYKVLGICIKAIWREADARIANSTGLRDMAYNYCSNYKFSVITNGVDMVRFRPGERAIDNGCINILFVSRLIERKGLQFIIPKLSIIQSNTDKSVKMTVVGEGPYKNELIRLTKEHNVQDIVLFVGDKRDDELVSYYQRGDIFILPSSNEGMPNVVLEAMACELPIVMTPCQGSAELISNNGYIAEIGEFEDRIMELINDDDKRMRMGVNSRKKVERLYAWDEIVGRYINVMTSCL